MGSVTDQTKAESPRRNLARELIVLAAFCGFFFYFGLGSFGLVGADEPRYAQIAREMRARHDWVTPVLNGAPWLEKPVLYYWGAMLSYKIFGVSDWAARLPSAVLASLMILAIYFFVRRFRPGGQLDAVLIAVSSAAIIGYARAASTDMPLAATFTVGMLAWYGWSETGGRFGLAAFYVCTALATLAKGPVAVVLAGLIIVVFALVRRQPPLIWRTLGSPALLLFVAVALPWYVAVQLRTPQFFRVFFLQHNFARFTENVFRHRQPFWYYLPVLLLSIVPWTVYALAACVRALRPEVSSPKHKEQPVSLGLAEEPEPPASAPAPAVAPEVRRDARHAFFVLWLAVPVLFFSFSESKLPGYLLPAIPAFALLLADYLQRVAESDQASTFLAVLHSALGGALLGASLLVPYFVLRLAPPRQAILVAAGTGGVVFAGMLVTLRLRGIRSLRLVTLVPAILGLAYVIRIAAPTIDNTLSARPVARALAPIEATRMPLAVLNVKRELEYGLIFYRDQPIRRYERGEIPGGQHLVVTPAGSEDALRALLSDRRVSRVGEFRPQGLEFFWVGPAGGGMGHHHGS